MNKKSFVLYTDYLEKLERLSNEQKGQVFQAILEYQNDITPAITDPMAAMAFDFIKVELDKSEEKYQKRCEANKANGLKGGRPKNEEPNKPNGLNENPQKPIKAKKPDTDTVTETDNSKELNSAKPLRGIAKSLFDNLTEKIPELCSKHRVSEKTILSYKLQYELWINSKPLDKKRQNRDMKASVEAWILKDLDSGKLKRLEVYNPPHPIPAKTVTATDLSAAKPAWMKGQNV